jgi:hypothetical protein
VFDPADLTLAWPRHLFEREAKVLLAADELEQGTWLGAGELLVEEAFAGTEALDAFRTATRVTDVDLFEGVAGVSGQVAFLRELVDRADQLREARAATAYWSQRRTGSPPAPITATALRARFIEFIDDLHDRGYLDRAFPKVCTDDRVSPEVDPSWELEDRLGVAHLWPLRRSLRSWTEDLFFDLIEVFHDLVARPRSRGWHRRNECGWHWGDFSDEPARILYRWRVNRLLERGALPYRLADEGEDVGRLVGVTDEARTDLAAHMTARTDPSTGDRVRHAIALFRARTTDEHHKRSAVVDLAGVLEERRRLLHAHLLTTDEDALFHIANQFDIRHRNERQKPNYDPVFLDWVFWWYLATIELSDRLLARDATP